MKEGPDIALLGALIGDPARANMLTALMSGKALTASELAAEAGIAAATASSHLARLEAGGLVHRRRQGRHRYFALADEEVGSVLEAMAGLAAGRGHLRSRTGPKDPALRRARVCYDHLAGELGVRLLDSLAGAGHLAGPGDRLALTPSGRRFVADFGIDLADLEGARRPVLRTCLDWSARRSHLSGALGRAFLDRMFQLGWARRIADSRAIAFTTAGEAAFVDAFPVSSPLAGDLA